MSPRKSTPQSGKRGGAAGKTLTGFTAEERAAAKERIRELRAAARGGANEDQEGAVLAKIAGMAEQDRALAKRVHALVRAAAPDLSPKLWYGMPAYARGEKVVCFFQDARKFKSRYATLGFSDKANLDEGNLWPVVFAITTLTAAEEAKITALVKRAVG